MSGLELLRKNVTKIEKATLGICKFIAEIADKDSFVQTDVFLAGQSFVDGSEALGEGVVAGYASINDYPVTVIAQNAQVLGGSLSKAHADKISKAIDIAVKTNTPLISIIDSIGARIGEGVAVLEGYGKIIAKVAALKRNVPHIAILKGATVGLMSSYALSADIVFMGKDAILSFNPPLVVSAVSKSIQEGKELDVQAHKKSNAACTFPYDSGAEIREKISLLFNYIQKPVIENLDDPNRVSADINHTLTPEAVLQALCDDKKYLELFADYATDVKTCLASINSITVGIIQTNANGKNNLLNKASLFKAKKFISFLQSYHIPLITLVDSEGIDSNLIEELDGTAIICAELAEMVALSGVAKVAVVTGSAIGYAYTVFCSKAIGFDYVLAFAASTIMPIKAEIAVSVAHLDEINAAKDPVVARKKLVDFYQKREGNPLLAGKEGYVDNVIEPALLRPYVASILTALVR